MPAATTYLVALSAYDPGGSPSRSPESLHMGSVRIAAAYAGSALVYRLDEVRYTSDPYNAFAADPGAMLENLIAEWLDHSGRFGTVSQPGSGRPARYVLEASVSELYGDFREGKPPAAVISIQFALIDQTNRRPTVVYERTMARRVNLPTATANALVRGYGTGLAEILSQVAGDLSARLGH